MVGVYEIPRIFYGPRNGPHRIFRFRFLPLPFSSCFGLVLQLDETRMISADKDRRLSAKKTVQSSKIRSRKLRKL